MLKWLLISQSMQQLYMPDSCHQIISWLKILVRFQFSNGFDWADKNGYCLNSQKWCVSFWGPNQAPTLIETASARGYCTVRGQIFLVAWLWHCTRSVFAPRPQPSWLQRSRLRHCQWSLETDIAWKTKAMRRFRAVHEKIINNPIKLVLISLIIWMHSHLNAFFF